MKAICAVLLATVIVGVGINISVYTSMMRELNILSNDIEAIAKKCINLTK